MNENSTIKFIAQKSGFSISTVSRVLRGSTYPVSKEARERILKLAEEFNYRPNLSARALKTNKTMEIAVIVPSLDNPFYTSLISGIESVAIQYGYHLILYNTKSNKEYESKIYNNILSKRVDGVILATALNGKSFIKDAESSKISILLADCAISGAKCSSIYFDYVKGSYLCTEHLIKMGHKKIAYIGLETDRKSRLDRLEGFKSAFKNTNTKFVNDSIFLSNNEFENKNDFEIGMMLTEKALHSKFNPTAIVALNDILAFGALHYLHTNNVKIPEEISVVGFDDVVFSEVSLPPLTTIRVPSVEMGKKAASILIDNIKNGIDFKLRYSFEPILIERSSVTYPK